jgi:hypothetical protein
MSSSRTVPLSLIEQRQFIEHAMPGRIRMIRNHLEDRSYSGMAVVALTSRAVAEFLGVKRRKNGQLAKSSTYFEHSPGLSYAVKIRDNCWWGVGRSDKAVYRRSESSLGRNSRSQCRFCPSYILAKFGRSNLNSWPNGQIHEGAIRTCSKLWRGSDSTVEGFRERNKIVGRYRSLRRRIGRSVGRC